ncbi:MAG: D-glycerate dehydrogenase [Chloroflexota bacterium]|nr:MAG: D-glycerate dehydrogenase [Chloroflexota bacterium]
MAKPKVFVTRIIPDKGFDLVKATCEVDLWTEELPPPYEVLLERVRGVDGLLCLLTDRIDGPLMDAAGPQLKVISNHAVGFDNIDIPAATARKIPVGNTPGILTDATADFAFALLVAAARRVVEGDRYVRAGKWKTWGPSILLGPDITGATLGIIGYGRIGQAMAKRASGFDMRILYYDPMVAAGSNLPGTAVDLETLLRESDFISLHTLLNEQTRHLINRDTLALMKPGAVLVNTSRGPVVDGQALYEALKEGKIFAAALDVTDPEPLPMDSPLLELDNLIIAPHIASASKPTRDKMSLMAVENLLTGLNGQRLPNCVNPELYAG